MVNDQIVKFWESCCHAHPELDPNTRYSVKSYGNTPELADLLLGLIRDGEKTGTFATEWEFEADPSSRPREGDHVVVVDGSGTPGCLYRIDTIQALPFNEITEEHVAGEGPSMRELEPWKKMHWAYWTRVLEGTGHEPTQDMTVLVQYFTVLQPDVTSSH